jgi:hypothetical protein
LCDVETPTFSLGNQLIYSGEVVSLKRWPPFTPGRFLVFISVRGGVDSRAIVRLEGLGQMNIPMAKRIETATLNIYYSDKSQAS